MNVNGKVVASLLAVCTLISTHFLSAQAAEPVPVSPPATASSPPPSPDSDPGTAPASPPSFSAEEATIQLMNQVGIKKVAPRRIDLVPGFTFTHFSRDTFTINGVAILPVFVLGEIQSQQVRIDIKTLTLSVRWGVTDRLQLEGVIPYLSQRSTATLASGQQSERKGNALGDIEAALQYQLLHERANRPDIILGLRLKTTTGVGPFDTEGDEIPSGTGFYSGRVGFGLVRSTDPVVLFAGAGYTENMEKSVGGRRINPVDLIDYSVGATLALSPEFSLGLGFDNRITTGKTRIETGETRTDIQEAALNIANLRVTGTWSYGASRFLTFSVSEGLTTDSPDFSVALSLSMGYGY